MSIITPQDVKNLREETGAPLFDCKKALEEADNDFQKAITILKVRGAASAVKKMSRTASVPSANIFKTNEACAIMLCHVESDFVATSEMFRALMSKLCEILYNTKSASVDEFLSAPLPEIDYSSITKIFLGLAPGSSTVNDLRSAAIAIIGENIIISQVKYIEIKDCILGTYIHTVNGWPNTAAVLLLSGEGVHKNPEIAKAFADKLAMQCVATRPMALSRETMDKAHMEEMAQIYRERYSKEGKKPEIVEKVTQSAIETYLKENTLLSQPLIGDEKQMLKVSDHLKALSNELGGTVSIQDYYLV